MLGAPRRWVLSCAVARMVTVRRLTRRHSFDTRALIEPGEERDTGDCLAVSETLVLLERTGPALGSPGRWDGPMRFTSFAVGHRDFQRMLTLYLGDSSAMAGDGHHVPKRSAVGGIMS